MTVSNICDQKPGSVQAVAGIDNINIENEVKNMKNKSGNPVVALCVVIAFFAAITSKNEIAMEIAIGLMTGFFVTGITLAQQSKRGFYLVSILLRDADIAWRYLRLKVGRYWRLFKRSSIYSQVFILLVMTVLHKQILFFIACVAVMGSIERFAIIIRWQVKLIGKKLFRDFFKKAP